MVRDISDLDTVDLPNSLLDTFIKEAFQLKKKRFMRLLKAWTMDCILMHSAKYILII